MATEVLVGSTKRNHTLYACGDVRVDVDARIVLVGGRRVLLTFGEFELLLKLVADPGRAFSRDELHGDHGSSESTPRAVDLRVMRLRKKLAGAKDFSIETVPHIGYRCWAASGPDRTASGASQQT
jgi:DNA-binding response OmpR family regulator